MANEILTEVIMVSPVESFKYMGEIGADKVRGFAPIVGAAAVGMGGMLLKNKIAASASETSGNGRVKRVPAGHLGLRERNNNFYKITPVMDEAGNPTYDEEGNQAFDKKFFELMRPGFRFSIVPWRKYELHDTRTISREIKPTKAMGMSKRLYDIEARFEWGYIRGFDENKQRIEYRWSNGDEVSVEQLVLNGIMAGRDGLETSERVGAKVGSLVRGYLSGLEDAGVFDDEEVFDFVRTTGHDHWLSMGAELRGLEITQASPTDADHVMNDMPDSQLSRIAAVLSGIDLPNDRSGGLRPVGEQAG